MFKDLIRILGLSLIISGITLYFIPQNEQSRNNESLKADVQELQTTLKKREEEIAKLQTASEKPAEADTKEEGKQEIKTFKLTIEDGDTSLEIATILEGHKLIKNADDFNKLLKSDGYATKIQVGSYELNNDMSMEEIATEITTK